MESERKSEEDMSESEPIAPPACPVVESKPNHLTRLNVAKDIFCAHIIAGSNVAVEQLVRRSVEYADDLIEMAQALPIKKRGD